MEFEYGDIVYGLYSNYEYRIETKEDFEYVNYHKRHFTTDKEFAIKFRAKIKNEEE